MEDDNSMLSGDEGDFMSCDSREEYQTALGSVMREVPQGRPDSSPQTSWYPTNYQGDARQIAPRENFFDEPSQGVGVYEALGQTEAQRPIYPSAPHQQLAPQYMDRVLIPAPPTVTVEDWDDSTYQGQSDDFVLEHYQHSRLNPDLLAQQPASEEFSIISHNFLPESQEIDGGFFAYPGDSTAPWTHLSVEGGEAYAATRIQHIYPSASSRDPSAGMPSGSGYSSLLNGADNGTSDTSAEPYQQNMTDSMLTERQLSLTMHNGSYAPQWINSSNDAVFAHDTSPLEGNPRGEWSEDHERRTSSSSFNPQISITGEPEHEFQAPSPALSATPSDWPAALHCTESGCSAAFTGTHRRGTLHRHIRLKHKGQQFPCRVCKKLFQRQDARLKHYRSKHNELLELPAAISRKRK